MASPLPSDSPLVYHFSLLFLSSTANHSARCYTSHLVATFIISMASLLLSSWGSPTPSNNIMKILKKTNFPHPHYQRGSTNCGIAILEGVFIGDTVTLLDILHWDTFYSLMVDFLRWWLILRHDCFRDCACIEGWHWPCSEDTYWGIAVSLAMDYDLS